MTTRLQISIVQENRPVKITVRTKHIDDGWIDESVGILDENNLCGEYYVHSHQSLYIEEIQQDEQFDRVEETHC